MTPDEEIDRLDALLDRLHREYPNTTATLRITNTAFMASDRDRWDAHGWKLSMAEVANIGSGIRERREAALLALLRVHYIDKIEIVPGIDIIEIVPAAPSINIPPQ